MAFTPNKPENPSDLFATFSADRYLNGLVYDSPTEGMHSRINGEWVPLDDRSNPFASGSLIVFVKPQFVDEFDYIREVVGRTVKMDYVTTAYGINPGYDVPAQPVTAAADSEESSACPPATQDIALNLKNRENAIDTAGYGPLNPNRPNDEFWIKKAERWSTNIDEAKSSRCGNCAVFIRTPKMLDCIESGLGNEQGNDAWGAIDAGELGYCEAFDFKCAASRTCDAWVAGGPVTEEKK